ncbi:hypothetical protein T06_7649 [Trichinella sp. T6]|nr:hypothetical protein T06_7649 [Trichinella sp. T6]
MNICAAIVSIVMLILALPNKGRSADLLHTLLTSVSVAELVKKFRSVVQHYGREEKRIYKRKCTLWHNGWIRCQMPKVFCQKCPTDMIFKLSVSQICYSNFE